VFERFTERARQVVVLAQDEARALKHNYIGTEHILLGLLREEEGLAARVLESLDVNVEEVRLQVGRIVGQGDEVTAGQIPFTPRAKKVLELSLREALGLGHNYIGTEHVLLGLLREGEGVAIRILMEFADPEDVHSEVLKALSGSEVSLGSKEPYVPKSPPLATDVATELERVRTEKEEAIEAQDFERAARLRERERRVTQAARELERAWSGQPPLYPPRAALYSEPASPTFGHIRRMPRRVSDYAPQRSTGPLLLGWVLFAAAAGIGILIGWAIWG
jgi:ATP-dependent Clp protease ATP-binding subunit ClpA